MPNTSRRTAVYQMLVANQTLLALLGDGANSIISTASLTQGNTSSVKLPVIVIQELETPGSVKQYPFSDTRFNLIVYAENRAPNTTSFLRIDKIIEEAIDTLHRKPISLQMSYYAPFEIEFDNYISRDNYDYYLSLPMKLARFCLFGTHLRYEQSGY